MSEQIKQHLAIIASQMCDSKKKAAKTIKVKANNDRSTAEHVAGGAALGGITGVTPLTRQIAKTVEANKQLNTVKKVLPKTEAIIDKGVKNTNLNMLKKVGKFAGAGALGGAAIAGATKKYMENKVAANEVTAAGSLAPVVKNIAGKTKDAVSKYGAMAKEKAVAAKDWAKANPSKAAAGALVGIGAGILSRKKSNQVSAMEMFNNITAAEYLDKKLNGELGNNVTANDMSAYMEITAMQYLVMANEETAELVQASDDIIEALIQADTEEEVKEILDQNAAVGEAHAEKAEEYAEVAKEDDEYADEAAALAEFHAGKAEEAAEVENDVISSLYYEEQ